MEKRREEKKGVKERRGEWRGREVMRGEGRRGEERVASVVLRARSDIGSYLFATLLIIDR